MKTNKKEDKPKTFLGLPMNWDRENIGKAMWNKDDDRLFPPKGFGIGWTINFYVVCKKLGLLSTEKKPKK